MATERSELDGPGTQPAFDARPLVALATPTVAAFLGRTQRGPLNEPVTLTSTEAFRRIFGQSVPYSHLPQCVAQYFQHGGRVAVVVRVANRASRARLTLPAGDEWLHLQAVRPGSEEHLRVSIDYDAVSSSRHFNLVVQRLLRQGSELVEDQEFFQDVSIAGHDERFIVDVLADSELVRLTGPLPSNRPTATRPKHPGAPIPYVSTTVPGSDGDELSDYDFIGSRAESTGLFALEHVETVDLVCIPPVPGRELGATVFLAAERYCQRRRAMLVWDPPSSWRTPETALIQSRQSVQASMHVLAYFPRVQLRGGHLSSQLPACGIVAGLLAQADEQARRRAGQWRSTRFLGYQPATAVRPREQRLLRRHGINVFMLENDGGYRLEGNVTLAGPFAPTSAEQRLDRQRLRLYILNRIERCARLWQETSAGERELEQQLRPFLDRLYAAGAFVGTSPDQAYFVKVSRRGEVLTLCFGFAFDRPGDFLRYELTLAADGFELRALTAPETALAG